MACHRFADQLRAHAAGAEMAPEMRAHLERCDDCRNALARERRLVAGITSDLTRALQIEPSVEFKARVRQRIADNPAKAGSHIFVGSAFGRIALAAASFAILAAVVTTVVTRRTGTPQHASSSVAGTNVRGAIIPAERGRIARREEVPGSQVPGNVAAAGARDAARSNSASARHAAHWNGASAGAKWNRASALFARTREPEVLVPPDRRVALDNLIAMIRAGKIDEKSFPAAAETAEGAPPQMVVAPIVVEELKVPPITVPPTAGTTEKR